MMTTKDIKDYIKSLPTATPSVSKLPIAVDEQGQMYKVSPFLDLKTKETAGSTIGIVEFAKKYLQDIPVGTICGDNLYNTAQAWFVKVNDSLTLNLQSYVLMVAKKYQLLTQAWSLWSLLLLPVVPSATPLVIHLRTTDTTNVIVMAYDFSGQPL